MPRLVRRKPLWDRISGTLNPMDFLLWLSEEMETRDWDSKMVGTQLGLGLNFVFLLAQANSGSTAPKDDVFSDEKRSRWISLFIYPLVWGLVALSLANAAYAMSRSRKYRMFEANIEIKPSTPSARRVQVESSPVASSPLRYFADMITPESAESRAHPDKRKDVWEVSVWDPLPMCLRLFCLFSPGHVLVYLLFLPLAPLDPRPSVTIFNTLAMQVVLSVQLLLLSSRYSQQAKDSSIIQKEVMHEYDTKFVHPRIHPVVRDAGTQMSETQPPHAREFVQIGTPTTLIRRTFTTHGNPHVDAEPVSVPAQRNVMRPQMFTPTAVPRRSESFTPSFTNESAAFRNSLPIAHTPVANVGNTADMGTSTGNSTTRGGFMSAHTHNLSPLKKTISMGDMTTPEYTSPRNSREMAAYEQMNEGRRPSSPTKLSDTRRSVGMPASRSTNSLGSIARNRAQQRERYPSRW